MRRLLNVIAVTLALNFIALAGFAAWLHKEGRLTPENILAIRKILFPPPPPPQAVLATRPVDSAATRPVLRLEELLAKYAGRPPAEQLEHIRGTFDAHMAQLERAQRELLDLRRQVLAEKEKLAADRKALDDDRRALAAREKEAQALASDKGFQDSLELYLSLPAKQVKTVFMGLDDATVVRYLQNMEPRAAARITREFKTPEETERLKRLLERMRQPQASAGS